MNNYSDFVYLAVKRYMRNTGVSSAYLAKRLGMERGTFYARMHGRRKWTVEDLQRLSAIGVDVPRLPQPRRASYV
ncbi:helix-turn-helix domain-containing protein [Trueperella sp. LYQ143]|uniref:helix-turn-helix domain-containing protein n=1 Tax=Trueperella sp. LYQ143 TaxID=3391059 RepID=UPI00398323DD